MRKYFLLLSLFLFVGFEPSSLFAQAGGYSAPQTGSGSSGSGIPYGTGGGTAQAQTVTTTPNITALTTGTYVTWLPVAANTAAAPTLAAGTTSATAITKCGTVALVAGDLLSTVWAVAQYDGTEWVLQNPVTGGCFGGLPTTGGTANAPTLTISPAITAYSAGMIFNFTNGAANTGATTIAVSGLAAKSITKCGTTALVANDLTVAATAVILYDGTEFQLLNPQSAGGACGGGSSVIVLRTYESLWSNNTAAQPGQNTTLIWGIYNNQPITTSTITYQVNVADNTANLYDIGIYNSSGTLLVHTGATAGTTFAPNTSPLSLTWTGGAVTIPVGKMYIAYTTNCSASCAKFFAGAAFSFLNANSPTGGMTSGGALNSSITIPADAYGNSSAPSAIIR